MKRIAEGAFAKLRKTRQVSPQRIAEVHANRQRGSLDTPDGKLFLVAADHPARGALAVGSTPTAMGNRYELLSRLVTALTRPGVDGVLGTPDIIDDLALLGALEGKVVVGSMNRGGLRNSTFEIDDRYTGYDMSGLVRDRLDFAKLLLRIDTRDSKTPDALEAASSAVSASAEAKLPIMIEPFISHWINGKIANNLTPNAVILSAAIAAGLGTSSAYSWLKLPVVEDMGRVMESTTLPTLLLGGDHVGPLETQLQLWEAALALPGVVGLTVGRTLLYPADNNVEKAVDAAARLVHG